MEKWKPKDLEDRLLLTYYKRVGGRIYTEVSTPWSGGDKDWPSGYSNRRIDAVRLLEPEKQEGVIPFANHGEEVLESVRRKKVELIEIKESLNRPVIGQLLAGYDLFKADYSPSEVKLIALCKYSEPGLEWVCEKRDIGVEIVEPGESTK